MIFKFFTFSKKQQKTMWVLLAVKMCMQVSFAVAMFGVFNTHSSAVGNNIRRKDAILKIDIREHRLPVTSKGKVADNPLFRKVFQKTFKEQKIYLIPYFFDCTEQYIVLNPDRSPISIDKGTIGSNVTDPKKIWVESLQQILENNTIPVKDTFVNQSDCYAIEIDRENINKRLFITQKISDLSSDNEFINLFKDTSYSHVAKFVKLKCKTNAKCYFIFYYKNEKGNINFLSKDFERYFIFTGNQTQLNEKIPAALKDNFDIQFDKNIEIITLILKKGMHLRVLLIVDLTTQFDLHDVPKRYNYAGFSDIWQRYPNYRGTLSWIYEAIKNKNGIDLTDFEKTFLKQYESNEQYVSERVQKIQEIDKEKQQREALAEQKRVEKEKAKAEEIEKKRQGIPSQNRPIGQSEQEPAMQKSVQDEVTAIQKRRLPTISESPITTPRGTNVAQIKEKVFSPRKPVGRSVSLGSQENVQETESSRIEIMQPTQVTKKEEKSDSKSAITLSEEGSKKPLQQEPVEKSKTIEEVAEIERQVIKEKVVVSEEELKVESEKLRVAKEKKQKLRKKMIGSPILLSPAKQSEPVEKSKKTEELAEKKRPQGAKRWTVSEKELKEGPEKLRLEKQKEQEEFVREKKLKTPTVLPYPTQPQSDTYEQVEDLPGKGGGEKTEPDEEPETPKLEEQETERKKTKENDNPVNPINTNVSKESSQSEQSSWTKDIQNWFIKVLKSIIDWGYSLFID